MSEYHTPVLLEESISFLVTNPEGIYADATFGGGGHTALLLSRLLDGGRVIAFDRDIDAIENGLKDPRLTLVHNNFRFIENYAVGQEAQLTAADVVNTYPEERLVSILSLYGEVENSRQIARLIKAAGEIRTTGDLDRAIAKAIPQNLAHKILAKIYQALRIEVNGEMRSLEKFLEGTAATIKPGGRLAVISYHSLEDRMVKNFIRTGRIDGVETKDIYGRVSTPWEAVTRKPVLPSESEIAGNTRARSAKLRVAERRADA